LLFLDRGHHFIEMPFIGEIGSFAPKLVGVPLPKFLTPFPNRFVRQLDAPVQHHLFDIPVAQGKGVVKPDTITDDFARRAMTRVHEPEAANKVESVRLFYLSVNLEAGATWQLLEQSVHIHPTYGEALPSLARLLVSDDMPSCPNM
jgi:hypothetical protein